MISQGELPRTPLRRSSENSYSTHSGEEATGGARSRAARHTP